MIPSRKTLKDLLLRSYSIAIGIWLLFTTLVFALIIYQDLRKASHWFEEITLLLYSDIYRRIQSNEVVLEGFAALINLTDDNNLEQVESFANQMLFRYPHIYELEIARRVSKEELGAFEASMRQRHIPGFKIKSFAYQDNRTWRPVDEKPFYYPIVYIAPTLPESSEVPGLDMDSVPFLSEAMHESAKRRLPVATKPFNLVQGDRAYVIFKAVENRQDDSSLDQGRFKRGELYALQVIKAEQLLSRELLDSLDLKINLYHTNYSEQAQNEWLIRHQPNPPYFAESFLLPNLRFLRTVDVSSQPFVVSVSKQLGWNDISSGLLITILGISVVALTILLAYGKAYRLNETAREKAERRQLRATSRVEIVKREGETRYRSLVSNLPVGLFRATSNPLGRFVTTNPAMASIFGYRSPEEILSTNLSALFQNQKDWKSLADECLKIGRVAREVQLLDKDGKRLWGWITASTVSDKNGIVQFFDGFLEDITLRKDAQDLLKKNEQRFRLMYEQSPLGYQSLNAEGRIMTVNPAWLKTLGYTRDEVIWRWFGDFLAPESRKDFEKEFPRRKTSNEFHGQHFQMLHKNGARIETEIDGRIVRDERGRFRHTHCILHDITERKQKEFRIHRQANYDVLTGLPNRILFSDRLNQNITKARREQGYFALLFIDLDHFKQINDTLGHAAGDKVLKEAARRLRRGVRESDTVARLGGDEFVVILPGIKDVYLIERLAAELIRRLSESCKNLGFETTLSGSIGIAMYPDDGRDADSLLANADRAMYLAKQRGRNTCQFFSGKKNDEAAEGTLLEYDLRSALDRKEFYIKYQPIINLRTGEMTRAEALLRWKNPRRGRVLPDSFLPIAEDSGFILEIGEWIFDSVGRQIRAWNDAGYHVVPISLNLSPHQCQLGQCAEQIQQTLNRYGLDTLSMAIEFTEDCFLSKDVNILRGLNNIHGAGISLYLDDFGKGFSSINQLHSLPVEALKIDRSFVAGLSEKPDYKRLSEAIIGLAHNLGLEVIAKGVETEMQKRFLKDNGCEMAQGYLFSHSLSPEEFTAFLLGPKSL